MEKGGKHGNEMDPKNSVSLAFVMRSFLMELSTSVYRRRCIECSVFTAECHQGCLQIEQKLSICYAVI